MKKLLSIAISLAMISLSCAQNEPEITNPVLAVTGNVVYLENFPSEFVDARNIDIWLPEGYDSTDATYQVLYMHDGQNVFNPQTSYNGNDWMVDEVLTELIANGEVEPAIVVGVWNNGEKRYPEYMPQKPADVMNSEEVTERSKRYSGVGIISDNYLKFLVEELKPYIDENYRTKPEPEFTSVMGSSMGGLISLYAISEYPDVFGGAGCLSTHWVADDDLDDAFVNHVGTSLPDPATHRIYFDQGTEGLDGTYEPGQTKVDGFMKENGYVEGENWVTKVFEGHHHMEQYWAMRIDEPLKFLLSAKETSE